ncbi:MAG: Gfo/Idh/MocA family oxidoreductase [Actinomycetota bacterium]|nr:Gfo/Idh/MocA family oxidoreductase [Actinomycetota bacterium]
MTLRVGMIGAGNMANVHADGWEASGDQIVAILDADAGRAAEIAGRTGARVADDLDDLLRSVDAIDICTPTDTHLEYVTAGAAAGVAVVCEKPLARTGQGARAAVAACAGAGVPLLVGHVVRFFPEYVEARARVEAGDIGDVAVVRLDRSTYLPAGASAWFKDPTRSGGVVYDLMIHDIDYAGWIAGKVTRAYARVAASSDGGEHVLATLRHEGGAISHVQASWAFPVGSFRTSLEIAGSEGLITRHAADPFRSLVAASPDVPDVPAPPTSGESPYVTQIRHFSDVLHGDATSRIDAEDAAAAVEVCDAIAASIISGRATEVGEAL